MRIVGNFTLSALAFALVAWGPVTARSVPTLLVDESVEGATPVLTLPAPIIVVAGQPAETINAEITPVAGSNGEEWTLFVALLGSAETHGAGGNLLESAGSRPTSDALVFDHTVDLNTSFEFFYTLFSDDDSGNIGGTCTDASCSSAVEDGTFQVITSVTTSHNPLVTGDPPPYGTLDIAVKSDIDSVPEPGSGLILAGALGGLWLARRWRSRAS